MPAGISEGAVRVGHASKRPPPPPEGPRSAAEIIKDPGVDARIKASKNALVALTSQTAFDILWTRVQLAQLAAAVMPHDEVLEQAVAHAEKVASAVDGLEANARDAARAADVADLTLKSAEPDSSLAAELAQEAALARANAQAAESAVENVLNSLSIPADLAEPDSEIEGTRTNLLKLIDEQERPAAIAVGASKLASLLVQGDRPMTKAFEHTYAKYPSTELLRDTPPTSLESVVARTEPWRRSIPGTPSSNTMPRNSGPRRTSSPV